MAGGRQGSVVGLSDGPCVSAATFQRLVLAVLGEDMRVVVTVVGSMAALWLCALVAWNATSARRGVALSVAAGLDSVVADVSVPALRALMSAMQAQSAALVQAWDAAGVERLPWGLAGRAAGSAVNWQAEVEGGAADVGGVTASVGLTTARALEASCARSVSIFSDALHRGNGGLATGSQERVEQTHQAQSRQSVCACSRLG